MLKSLPDELFDMTSFRARDEESHVCNSVACIVGHATSLDTPENIDRFRLGSGRINFYAWSEHFFGIKAGSREWEYMFGVIWAGSLKTYHKDHAIYRIQKVIDGYIPQSTTPEFHSELYNITVSDGDYVGHWKKNKKEYLKSIRPVWR